MRSDQVFVLLLIILIPMTGCFDNSVGDAEGSQDVSDDSAPSTSTTTSFASNLPPVVSVETIGSLANVEGSDCTTTAFEIEVRHAMTDWDGSIANAGWDVNLDGVIDYPTNVSEGYMMIEIPMNTMVSRTATSSYSTYIENEYRERSIVFGAQDDDGAWTSSELIKLSKTISSTNTNSGLETSYVDVEPCHDFSDVTDYEFSVTDHSDIASTGNADFLVEITRTNGQSGLDWSRVRIVFDGDNEGDEVCSPTSYRCKIVEITSLWEANSTITLQEASNLHNGNGEAEVMIYIDNILVERVEFELD